MSARDDVLARIRSAIGADAAPPPVPREYRRTDPAGPGSPELVERLVDRLVDYQATVHSCPPSGLTATVSAALAERGARRVVVPPGTAGLVTGAEALVDTTDAPLDVATLDGVDGVVTGCAVAIAETGTIVLDGDDACGRRAITLVPDYHLVVVRADQVVGSVPEGLARLDPTRPLTFVSGPSATSDIELSRVEGVHGPRTLVVVIVS